MPRGLLVDACITPKLAREIGSHRPDILIVAIHDWRQGTFRDARSDEVILLAARDEDLALVTRDVVTTIATIAAAIVARGDHHSGVIFVSQRGLPPTDIGALVRAVIQLWDARGTRTWRICVYTSSPSGRDRGVQQARMLVLQNPGASGRYPQGHVPKLQKNTTWSACFTNPCAMFANFNSL